MYDAIRDMLLSLDDPYTRYLPREKYDALTSYATGGKMDFVSEEGDAGGGIGVRLLEDPRSGDVLVMGITNGGPADIAGVRAGDAIIAIDGMDARGMTSDIVASKCRGRVGDEVNVDIQRGDDGGAMPTIRHLRLTRARIDNVVNRIESSIFVSGGGRWVGLLRVPSFSTETASQMVDGLRYVTTTADGGGGGGGGGGTIDAIAIDIRGNVGGYMEAGVDVARLFLPAGDRIISEVGRPMGAGGSSSSSSSYTKIYDADGIGARTSVPVYVLVDQRTASAAEIFACALQDNKRATIVGTTSTFGKGRIQTVRPLGNGYGGVAITRARYVTPSGRDLHGVGIKPDRVPVRCGIEDTARTCLADIV